MNQNLTVLFVCRMTETIMRNAMRYPKRNELLTDVREKGVERTS